MKKRLIAKAGKSRKVLYRFLKGKIMFYIKPWADVWVNGSKIGQTPLAPIRRFPGTYRVVLKMKKKTHATTINLNSNETYRLRYQFK